MTIARRKNAALRPAGGGTYARRTGADLGSFDLHRALAAMKLAVILEGFHARYLGGHTVGDGYDRAGEALPVLVARDYGCSPGRGIDAHHSDRPRSGRGWTRRAVDAAGHDVVALGRSGDDATGVDVMVVAVPVGEIGPALRGVRGLNRQFTIDTCNAFRKPREPGYPLLSHQIQAVVGGPSAMAFSTNFPSAYGLLDTVTPRPCDLDAADPAARDATERLIRDVGFEPVFVGDLDPRRVPHRGQHRAHTPPSPGTAVIWMPPACGPALASPR